MSILLISERWMEKLNSNGKETLTLVSFRFTYVSEYLCGDIYLCVCFIACHHQEIHSAIVEVLRLCSVLVQLFFPSSWNKKCSTNVLSFLLYVVLYRKWKLRSIQREIGYERSVPSYADNVDVIASDIKHIKVICTALNDRSQNYPIKVGGPATGHLERKICQWRIQKWQAMWPVSTRNEPRESYLSDGPSSVNTCNMQA